MKVAWKINQWIGVGIVNEDVVAEIVAGGIAVEKIVRSNRCD